MNDAHEHLESDAPLDPQARSGDSPDNAKLAGAKDAVKKKLLRLVARQAIEELSDPEAAATEILNSGLIDDATASSIRKQLITPLIGRLMPEGSLDPDEVLAAAEADPKFENAIANVRQRLMGAISARVLEGFADEEALTRTLVDQLIESNNDAVEQLAEGVRTEVLQNIGMRAWQDASDSPDFADSITETIDFASPAIQGTVAAVRDSIAADVAKAAMESMSESEEITAAVAEASEKAREQVLSTIVKEVVGADDDDLAAAAVQRIGSDHQSVVAASRATKTRLLAAIRDRAVDAITDPEQTARQAWGHISGDEPAIVAAMDQLKILLYQDLGTKVLREITNEEALEATADKVVSRESESVTKAVDVVFEYVARDIANKARTRIADPEEAATAAHDYIESQDERMASATSALEDRLLDLIAERAITRIQEPSGLERIKQVTAQKESALIEATTASLRDAVIGDIVQRAGYSLSDAGDTARRARERMGSENAAVVAATEVLKELVLEDLAKNATFDLLEPAKAAERAFTRVDTGDPRFIRSSDAVRERLISAIADHSLTALASSDDAADTAYGRIDKANELIIGATAVLRDRLIGDIAGRAERALEDSRNVAEQARDRVPNESQVMVNATHSLRELLLEDVIAMTRTALEDAERAAQDAMTQLDGNDEVIARARGIFKERVLVTILGEAIREISTDVSGPNNGGGQGAFQQAFQALSHSMGSHEGFQPSGDGGSGSRRPAASLSVSSPSAGIRHDRVAAPPQGGTSMPSMSLPAATPELDVTASGALAPATAAEMIAVPGEAWTRLSDMDKVASQMEPVSAPEPLDDLIVTEYVQEAPHQKSGETSFDWSFEMDEEVAPAAAPAIQEVAAPQPDLDVTWEADDGTRCYVYGFIPSADSEAKAPKAAEGLDNEHPVRLVSVRGIRAIISKVPSEIYDEEPLAQRSRDGKWLKNQIRAHAGVLGAFKATETIVPMRFGVVFRTEADVAAMLDEQHDDLNKTLERLQGRREWAVRVSRNSDRLKARVSDSRREVEDSLESISSGVAQFVKDELDKSGELDDDVLMDTITQNCLKRVHAFLTKWSDGGMQKPLVSRPGVDQVMNAAYLIKTDSADEFASKIAQLEREFESLGLSFDTSGPWPPFHFVEGDPNKSAALVAALG